MKGRVFFVLAIVAILLLVPISVGALPTQNKTTDDTTTVVVQIGKQKIVREMSLQTIKELVELGRACKNDFLVIFNKRSTQEEVDTAFANIQPWFQALVDNGFAKSTQQLNTLFLNIRSRIGGNGYDPSRQPLGNWNGFPTPLFGNALCALFSAGMGIGWSMGSHMIIPTVGVDAINMWAGTDESVTIGVLGFTTSTGPEFGVTFGFAGVMIATPIVIVGPFIQVGFCGAYLGAGVAPV